MPTPKPSTKTIATETAQPAVETTTTTEDTMPTDTTTMPTPALLAFANEIQSAATTIEIAQLVQALFDEEPLLLKTYPTRKAARKAARRFNREFTTFIAYLVKTTTIIRVLPRSAEDVAIYEFQAAKDPKVATLFIAPYKASTLEPDKHVLSSIVQAIEVTTTEEPAPKKTKRPAPKKAKATKETQAPAEEVTTTEA